MKPMHLTTNNVCVLDSVWFQVELTAVDNIELVKGMPIGLQIVGGRFGEERAVAIARMIKSLPRP
jgi:Asp-tRNA(Asn)/Glu-tRNA(Gln) amidotransferase A subunit family amidase